jgi:adenine-specific DNA-methyltransferase
MTTRLKRLELTWIGKEDRPRLEPRILLEDSAQSYRSAVKHSENDLFDNRPNWFAVAVTTDAPKTLS